jgi:hypothetical protein
MSIIESLLRAVDGGFTESAFPLPPGELGSERVEPLVPEPVEPVEPFLELAKGRRVDGIQPTRAVGMDRREPAIPQDLEVLRHGRLRDPELGPDNGRDGPRGQLAVGEQLEDPPPDRVSQNVERVHEDDDTSKDLYKSMMIFN